MDEVNTPIYRPLYLPWHRPVLEKILSLKQQQRLPHAILIDAKSDQDGIGFIWHLMMLLLCENSNDEGPCETCQACKLMLANTYPDIEYVTLIHDKKSKKLNKNIKIEQIRELIHELHLSRRYDNLKIAAIFPADKLSIAGANSLLKTLEEPAPHNLLMLMTHNKGKLPVTIRSRCQIWTLDLPDQEASINWLIQQGMLENEATQYIEFSRGDPQLALKLRASEYASLVDRFKQQFALYLNNETDIANLSSELGSIELSLIRRLIRMVVVAYCYRFSGLDTKGSISGAAQKPAAQKVLDLAARLERQLMVEESNLNLQIQLEDVLISLKQIVKVE